MFPAGEANITVRRVALAGGLAIRIAESGPVGGAPLLLVHGWSANIYTFAEMIPALSNAGYRVAAIDLPGFGLSDKPTDDSFYTTRAQCDAVAEVAEKIGFHDYTYVGHSMGGGVGLSLVLRGDRRIRRLVLINAANIGAVPIAPIIRALSPAVVKRFGSRWIPRLAVAAILELAFGTSDRPNARDVDEYWAPTQFDGFVGACRACLHQFTWDAVDDAQLAGIDIPVLIVVGQRDRVVWPKRRVLPETVRSISIKDGGHLVLQERSERTNAEVLRFLSETAP